MPTFEQHLTVRITQRLKAFLNLEAGVVGAETVVGGKKQARKPSPRQAAAREKNAKPGGLNTRNIV